jgi:hypothetical protein
MRLNLILFVIVIFFNSISLFSQETVIFHDDFKSNDKGWLEEETSISKLNVNTNRRMYVLEYKYKNTKDAFTSWKEIEIDESRDYSISALLYKEKGVKDYGYGIIWGAKKENFYSFLVSPQGSFCIGKVIEGKWNNITTGKKGWVNSGAVAKGRRAFNKLTMSKIGNKFHFEINGIKVATMDSEPFFGKNIGFNVNNKQKILIDWIKVSYLN